MNNKAKTNRKPKRMSPDELKYKIVKRIEAKSHRGASLDNIIWDTLRYDDKLQKQVVEIKTVNEDGELDGNTRLVATSDLQHVKHTKETSLNIQRRKNNERRRLKNKLISK
jgi:hypothetical protein